MPDPTEDFIMEMDSLFDTWTKWHTDPPMRRCEKHFCENLTDSLDFWHLLLYNRNVHELRLRRTSIILSSRH